MKKGLLKNLLNFFGLFKERVLFSDLDGTITVTKSGKTFPENEEDWQFKDGIIDALKLYNPSHLFIVSNQGGIEYGYIDLPKWHSKMEVIINELSKELPKTKIEYSYEPSNNKANPRRKPNTGMLEEFYHDYIHNNDFEKHNALMIGDASGLKGQFSDSDYECAHRFGIDYLDVDYFINWSLSCQKYSNKSKQSLKDYIREFEIDKTLTN